MSFSYVCAACQTPFENKNSGRKYCSRSCANRRQATQAGKSKYGNRYATVAESHTAVVANERVRVQTPEGRRQQRLRAQKYRTKLRGAAPHMPAVIAPAIPDLTTEQRTEVLIRKLRRAKEARANAQ